ncbi:MULTISPECIES: PucR family transcriptional regulator ligand-binding domain-containing protein [unclassified Microbacterium]|uniref:PucR family transcriptional regulator n=1 Tax=unclassified Microbacterium TaxID=2609290 RepID=UPI00214B25CE|nr:MULTISPECIES: PucR family transcriptional regulator ligand-binding domain-containing protein [unclassified Microbacterium]MCR2811323.1 PucR family transcriptional regulator ligand-binding domain-containing protein [Microbacterium sp. zg.B185]WIM19480.1 PucR family transcriptional regulator ligand-binding domain-containing protein [Microbacterium sp. zg-B185]
MDVNYTLRDLIADSRLNVRLLTGDGAALDRPLMGAHPTELENPTRWIDPDWLMLTMGTKLRQRPSAQRQLIAELDALGATALGFGVGVAFQSVPPALLEEAEARNFPVLSIPQETQFQSISRVIFQSTVSTEAQTYVRLTSLQQNLMRAFSDSEPIDSALRRLAQFSNSVVALVSQDGHLLGATGMLPLESIVPLLDGGGLRGQQERVGEWDVMFAPLQAWPGGRATIVLALRHPAVSHSFVRMILDGAAPVFEALGGLMGTNRRHSQALTSGMLDGVLSRSLTDLEVDQVESVFKACGLEMSTGVRCVVVSSPDSAALAPVVDFVVGGFSKIATIATVRDGRLAMVLPAEFACEEQLHLAFGSRRLPGVQVGIGREVTSSTELSTSFRDAQIALRHLQRDSQVSTMAFDELGLAHQLLAEVPVSRVAAKVKVIADVLISNPIQFEALRAYFDSHQDVQVAAKKIFVHPNTLRYRLERFEHALGQSLRDPAVIASLHYVLGAMEEQASASAHSDELTAVRSA